MTSLRRDPAFPVPFRSLLLLFLAMAITPFLGEINVWRIAAMVVAAAGTLALLGLLAYRTLRRGDELLAELLDYSGESDPRLPRARPASDGAVHADRVCGQRG